MKLFLTLATIGLLVSCEQKKQDSNTRNGEQGDQNQPTTQSAQSSKTQQQKNKKDKTCCSSHPAPAATAASEDSIYQITSSWTDDKGNEKQLNTLAGKVQVISMGYSTCKFACPRLIANLHAIEAGLSTTTLANTGFAFFSIDPKTDTPQHLREYRKEKQLDPQHWQLFTAPTPAVQELAVVLGLKYRRISDADFAHSNLIIVLNQKGEIVHRQEGLSGDPTATIKAIEALH